MRAVLIFGLVACALGITHKSSPNQQLAKLSVRGRPDPKNLDIVYFGYDEVSTSSFDFSHPSHFIQYYDEDSESTATLAELASDVDPVDAAFDNVQTFLDSYQAEQEEEVEEEIEEVLEEVNLKVEEEVESQ